MRTNLYGGGSGLPKMTGILTESALMEDVKAVMLTVRAALL